MSIFSINQRLFCLGMLLLCSVGLSQNMDLLSESNSGINQGLAGAGIGLPNDYSAVDINPAGLAGITSSHAILSGQESYYKYELVNERIEEKLTRIFKWSKYNPSLKNILVAFPVKSRMGVSLGYLNRISPFLYNQNRAITWSPLFNQTTRGRLGSLFLAAGFKIIPKLWLGMTGYGYFGKISSVVHGENHGNDVDKWAELESSMRGAGLRVGAQFQLGKFKTGIIFEPKTNIGVKTKTSISENPLYEGLFPDYSETTWTLPSILGLGLAYTFDPQLLLVLDIEYRDYSSSEVQLNLYEYGGNPTWDNVLIYRLGLEKGSAKSGLPLRAGYAFIPQAYSSATTDQPLGTEAVIVYGDQNVKHLVTLGTSIQYSCSQVNLALAYSFIKWRRDLYTYVTVEENYIERQVTLFVEWVIFPR
ncbi:MAG: hypothetical protein HQ507_09925 [Candidatus Marinimicrobia bacterium]|nr:hypothetical protein [Candidatus Neomarinimicrobiota bacterium]